MKAGSQEMKLGMERAEKSPPPGGFSRASRATRAKAMFTGVLCFLGRAAVVPSRATKQ